MPLTTRYKLPYPAASDPADVPLDMQELAEGVETTVQPLAHTFLFGSVGIPVTTEAAAQVIVTAPAITLDGTTQIRVECYFMGYLGPTGAARIDVFLFDNGASIGYIAQIGGTGAAGQAATVSASRVLTPSAGSHTYSIRATASGSAGGINASGSNTPGALPPAFIRITKA